MRMTEALVDFHIVCAFHIKTALDFQFICHLIASGVNHVTVLLACVAIWCGVDISLTAINAAHTALDILHDLRLILFISWARKALNKTTFWLNGDFVLWRWVANQTLFKVTIALILCWALHLQHLTRCTQRTSRHPQLEIFRMLSSLFDLNFFMKNRIVDYGSLRHKSSLLQKWLFRRVEINFFQFQPLEFLVTMLLCY